jgi:hypothetical protein
MMPLKTKSFFGVAFLLCSGIFLFPTFALAQFSGNSCSSLISDDVTAGKGKPLMSLDECQRSCHTTCKQEKKSGQDKCYGCVKASIGICENVPGTVKPSACEPGGSCFNNPNMSCQSVTVFGNGKFLGKIYCLKCVPEPDNCVAQVGAGTMSRQNCAATCNGTCQYKGKYKFSANPDKFNYCYSCAQPTYTCEKLGWGSSNLQMCMANCPNGQCKNVKVTMGNDGKGHAGK